eukprot:3523571-Prorocentrum_lima.AAC.1
MTSSLVGSEMCIRDRDVVEGRQKCLPRDVGNVVLRMHHSLLESRVKRFCLLYTSDAADDM